jgi:S1-C subfamily serine protease
MSYRNPPVLGLAFLLCVSSLSPRMLGDCTLKQYVTTFGNVDSRARVMDKSHLQSTINEVGARYLRAKLRLDVPLPCGWSITVRDRSLRPVQTLADDDFQPRSISPTIRVNGAQLNLELHGCADGSAPSISVYRVIWMPEKNVLGPGAYYSLKSFAVPDWKELYEEAPLRNTDPAKVELGDVVGMLVLSTDQGAWSCSGFMITDSLFLTNWHCGANEDLNHLPSDYWTNDVINDAILDTSWDTDEISREFLVSGVEQADMGLDFAVLRVRPLGRPAPVPVATLANWMPTRGDSIYTIHHPLGMRKTYSGGCSVKTVPFANWKDPAQLTDFVHDCDTESGSSGAPLFNKAGEVVGIHHLGYDFDAACRVTSENKAVAMQNILDNLNPTLKAGLVIHRR